MCPKLYFTDLSTNNLLVVPSTPPIFHSTRSQYVPIKPHPIHRELHENHKDTTNIDIKVMHQLPGKISTLYRNMN